MLAFDAPRGRVFCAGDGEENASVETEVREEMRHEKCGMSSVHERGEARREKRDVCENEDEFEERVTQVKAEKEQVKRIRFREEEEPEETRVQITICGRGRTSPIQGGDQGKELDFISVEMCSEGRFEERERENSSAKLYEAVAKVRARNWEKRNSDIFFHEIHQEFECQASRWADQAQRDKN